jgi:hypothetical protein
VEIERGKSKLGLPGDADIVLDKVRHNVRLAGANVHNLLRIAQGGELRAALQQRPVAIVEGTVAALDAITGG